MSRLVVIVAALGIVALGFVPACNEVNGNHGPADFAGVDSATQGADLSCEGTGGCYKCPPATDPQFLNHCTSSTCSKFDNKGRLPLLNADGTLPPLP